MKRLVKIISVLFLIASAVLMFSEIAQAANKRSAKEMTFLAVGFDSAPENTDVLCVITYDSEANTVRAIQIPRDTAIKYGDGVIKINGFYSCEKAKGRTREQALSNLADKISSLLGIGIDGYFALTTDGFVKTVDYLGGVSIDAALIPKVISDAYYVENGKIHLDGEAALDFVRYRKDYPRGDLDRIDAQKVFLKSVFNLLKEKRDYFSFLKFISSCNEISFKINKGYSLAFVLQNISKASETDFQIATLPGRALKSGGVWYYVVNKAEAKALIDGYFPHENPSFDGEVGFAYDM